MDWQAGANDPSFEARHHLHAHWVASLSAANHATMDGLDAARRPARAERHVYRVNARRA